MSSRYPQPRSRSSLALASLLLLGACAGERPTGPATGDVPSLVTAATSISIVMSNLNAPKGLAWSPDGALYVVETGTTVVTGPCAIVARGSNCYSGTGSISRLRLGQQERVVTGLPSVFNASFNDIIGPEDISFAGGGSAHVTIGWGGAPAARADLGELGPLFGSLLQVKPRGEWRVVADVSAFEGAQNPAGGPLDSNPFGLLSEGGRQFVTDAGGNSLLEVGADGNVSLVAVFPSIAVPPGPFNPPFAESEAVPTGVTRGPDGALYISTLTGVPFLPGAASIYRVVPGQAPQVYATGFTHITDLDWSDDGNLYVLQYAAAPFLGGPGALIQVAPNGTRTTITTALFASTGVAVGPDGAIYVSNNGNVAGIGEVLRIVP